MAWTAPRTWVVGELVTAAIMNTHIRDNQIYLKSQTDLINTVTFSQPANAFDTNYQNATGKIKIVIISVGFANGNDESVNLFTENATPPTVSVGILRNNTNNIIQMQGTIVVPNGWYYKALQGGVPTLVEWTEWDFF